MTIKLAKGSRATNVASIERYFRGTAGSDQRRRVMRAVGTVELCATSGRRLTPPIVNGASGPAG